MNARRFPKAPAIALVVLVAGALATYAVFAARYVGGCDSWAYLSDSFVLRGMDVGLSGTLDPARFPALVPLCYELDGHRVLSIMLPGLPVLLALAGLVHAEFWLSPISGALGVALLYAALRRRSGPWIALGLTAIWATCPIVLWGSTKVMSDMAAASFGLLAYVLFERASETASGFALAFSFGIRVTNVLLLPAILATRPSSLTLRRFGSGLCLGIFGWAAFAFGRYGHLLPQGYAKNVGELSAEHVFSQFWFLVRTTCSMLWPVVVLALFGIRRRPRESLPLVAWFLSYVVLYSFWRTPFPAWWWTRYLLPAYPALFLLAAAGAEDFVEFLKNAGLAGTPVRALGALATLALCGRSLTFAEEKELLSRGFDEGYAIDSRRIRELVPSNALVGAFNFTGPLRMYAGLESFNYVDPRAIDLVDFAVDRERPVYSVIEPGESEAEPSVRTFRKRFEWKDVATLTSWGGLTLRRVVPRAKSRRLDLAMGTPFARSFLREGWSGDEFDEHDRWVWAVGQSSTLEVPLEPGRTVTMTLQAAPFVVPGRKQRIDVVVNGEEIASVDLGREVEARLVQLPGRVVRATNAVELRYAYAVSPKELGSSLDERKLAIVVERISFREEPP